jgi:hypothetical protein
MSNQNEPHKPIAYQIGRTGNAVHPECWPVLASECKATGLTPSIGTLFYTLDALRRFSNARECFVCKQSLSAPTPAVSYPPVSV